MLQLLLLWVQQHPFLIALFLSAVVQRHPCRTVRLPFVLVQQLLCPLFLHQPPFVLLQQLEPLYQQSQNRLPFVLPQQPVLPYQRFLRQLPSVLLQQLGLLCLLFQLRLPSEFPQQLYLFVPALLDDPFQFLRRPFAALQLLYCLLQLDGLCLLAPLLPLLFVEFQLEPLCPPFQQPLLP